MSANQPITVPFWLDESPVMFPPTELAMTDPDGLLAMGGALTPEWLLCAYSQGIFPWFNEESDIMWWSPNPRSVVFVDNLKVSKSLAKLIRQQKFTITFDKDFPAVIQACANIKRQEEEGTWILDDMQQAYIELHEQGHAHSVEVWLKDKLVGGLYGVAIGKVFFGESMFTKTSNASKVGFVHLVEQLKVWGFNMIDAQIESEHLNSLGAHLINRAEFEKGLEEDTLKDFPPKKWTLEL